MELINKLMSKSKEDTTTKDGLAGAIFKARISGKMEVKRFRALIDGSEGLLSDIELVVDEQKIQVIRLDRTKAAMVHWEIKRSFFESYEFEAKQEEIVMCVGAEEIKHAVSKAVDSIELELLPRSGKEMLKIQSTGKVNRQQNIRILAPFEDKNKAISLRPEGTCTTVAKELGGYVKQLMNRNTPLYTNAVWGLRDRSESVENEHGETITYQKGLTIEAEKDDGELFLEMEDEASVWNIQISRYGKQVVRLNTKFMHLFMKFFCKNDEIKLHLTRDKPVILESNEEGVFIKLVAAPIVEQRRY